MEKLLIAMIIFYKYNRLLSIKFRLTSPGNKQEMNTSSITYSNYQSGFIYNPVSRPAADTDLSVKGDQTFNRVVNTDSPESVTQTSQVSQTGQNPSKNDPSNSENKGTQPASDTTLINGQELTQAEVRLLDELEQIDTEVRRHEMAHIAAGGQYITSGANFTYKRGPDGRNYAVGGEVSIDTSAVPGDPKATLQKMRKVKSAALAPANPSSQDLKVASIATQEASKALSDLMILQAKDQAASNESKAFGGLKEASNSYEKVSNLPEDESSSFKIAV